jgi:phage terminase large subunit-like protein
VHLNLDHLTAAEKHELLSLLEEKERRRSRRRIDTYYPDSGPLRRELYPKHMAFFRAGVEHRERLMLAANRVGKTEGIGGYETAMHLTGQYPHWWSGRRFERPIHAWAAGGSNETTRDIVQAKLLGGVTWDGGRKGLLGTGLVPGDTLGGITWKQGVNDLVDTVAVKHQSGGWSALGIKSYQQGRKSFEGTEKDLIWLDEEPPLDVYSECLVRTMTTNGLVLLTFTPLEGMSEVVMSFLEDGRMPDVA